MANAADGTSIDEAEAYSASQWAMASAGTSAPPVALMFDTSGAKFETPIADGTTAKVSGDRLRMPLVMSSMFRHLTGSPVRPHLIMLSNDASVPAGSTGEANRRPLTQLRDHNLNYARTTTGQQLDRMVGYHFGSPVVNSAADDVQITIETFLRSDYRWSLDQAIEANLHNHGHNLPAVKLWLESQPGSAEPELVFVDALAAIQEYRKRLADPSVAGGDRQLAESRCSVLSSTRGRPSSRSLALSCRSPARCGTSGTTAGPRASRSSTAWGM
ncbi:hypothetical protein [Lentzea flava]|uniref:hypothetical protein n=1 Tax=Lentzea flava TaxID=103732 RepID=UPI00166F9AD3|nr:hypothetical protein [Lentzea flava]